MNKKKIHPEATAVMVGSYRASGLSMALARIAIPHFARETGKRIGYGSTRHGSSIKRQIALGRCLGSLINQQRTKQSEIYPVSGIGQLHSIETTEQRHGDAEELVVDIHVFVCGADYLLDVIDTFRKHVTLHQLALEDPLGLACAARDWLIKESSDADLYLYTEDDLVYADPMLFDKWLWFNKHASNAAVLMPHRYEIGTSENPSRLYIDGPLNPTRFEEFYKAESHIAQGSYRSYQHVKFDKASNPHAGCFAVSRSQILHLRKHELPRDGFIGPLETAATLTVLQHWPILKTSWSDADFFCIEHAHPSFLGHAQRMRTVSA